MADYPKSIEKLVLELKKLPGIGMKSAQRMAFYFLKQDKSQIEKLSNALLLIKDKVRNCKVCFNITEDEICHICADYERQNSKTICVVEDVVDLIAVEKSGEYRGLYHVLGGALSPLKGIGPSELRFGELVKRVKENNIEEVIIATNLNIEGEATGMYIRNILKSPACKVTRIAYGIPMGGELEYADEITMIKAMEGRKEF